ncbi:MAG: TIGR00341 family protein [Bacteroidales bacterium]
MNHIQNIINDFRLFLRERLDITHEKSNELDTIEAIKKGVEFKGVNLWILIFAIFIASLGLNTNSTAVIIGAMLISPLMGPIMGVGLGLGINDLELVNKSLKNLGIATVFSILTAALYFFITPLNEARSELLARTQPTIYDVMIAFFGGMAGIVAGSAKEKGNVIPGVAIATALMPPLCTAGYGLGTGQWTFFFGAFYLYFINSVFISLATYLGVQIMHFPKKEFMNPDRAKRVSRVVTTTVILTIIPSLWISYNMIGQSIFERNAENFIRQELSFEGTQIVNKSVVTSGKKSIQVAIIGKKITEQELENIRSKMGRYKLNDTELIISQGGTDNADITTLKTMVLEDFYNNSERSIKQKELQIDMLSKDLESYELLMRKSFEIAPEMKALFPMVKSLSFSKGIDYNIKEQSKDTVTIAVVEFEKVPDENGKKRLEEWLKARTKSEKFKLLVE